MRHSWFPPVAATLAGALAFVALTLGPASSSSQLACRIAGLEPYEIRATRPGTSCTVSSYILACADAEAICREKCEEFCVAFKALDQRTPCVGHSTPYAVLFDTDAHCNEARRREFDVSCTVTASCECTPVPRESGGAESPVGDDVP